MTFFLQAFKKNYFNNWRERNKENFNTTAVQGKMNEMKSLIQFVFLINER